MKRLFTRFNEAVMKQTMKLFGVMTMMLTIVFASAQNTPAPPANEAARKEKVEALKIAYITERLQLTPPEAQKFWPVYNSYQGDLKTLRQNFKLNDMANDDPALTDKKLEFEQKKLDLKKRYKPQFEGAVGPKKLALLMSAEDDFVKKLKEVQKRRQQRPQGGGVQGPRPRAGRRF